MDKMKISVYAKKQGLTYRTIWNYVKKGLLKFEKTPTGTILIIVEDEKKNESL